MDLDFAHLAISENTCWRYCHKWTSATIGATRGCEPHVNWRESSGSASSGTRVQRSTRNQMPVAALAPAIAGSCLVATRRRRRKIRRVQAEFAKAGNLLIKPVDCPKLIGASRPAHWVLRSSDLQVTLAFLANVFGMKVLRHEEYARSCAITCNGKYDTPWSKTMVGYGREDECYCLEVTYNYGISEYPPSNGLAHVAISVDSVAVAQEAALAMGCSVDGDIITGPDGYRFRVLPQSTTHEERFQYVAIKVANGPRASAFYEQALGMCDLSADFQQQVAGIGASAVFGYSRDHVPLVLLEDRSVGVSERTQTEGRNAIAIPGLALRALYLRVAEGQHGGAVLHAIREFNELPEIRRSRGLPPMPCTPPPDEYLQELRRDPSSAPPMGTLTVAIVTDVDGYEICLVSKEAYDSAVARAYTPDKEIDWAWRRDAAAGKRTALPPHQLACV
mmetsp:Transcript_126513/g.252820  ORF Transcript_126513/g.252820 Transcript_126513/m.252820 type:complete len:448 (+) Transcript_126513:67-1410(+)